MCIRIIDTENDDHYRVMNKPYVFCCEKHVDKYLTKEKLKNWR